VTFDCKIVFIFSTEYDPLVPAEQVGPIRGDPENNRPIVRRQPVRQQPEEARAIETDEDDVSDDDDSDSIDLLKRHVADLKDYIKCKRRARRMSREINRRNYAEILVRIVCNHNSFAVT